MNTLTATTSILTHSLAWALLYSLWQGSLIYGTLFVLLKALPNTSARTKYYMGLSAFSGLFLWFADTWAEQYQKLKGVTVYITQAGIDAGAGTTYSVKTFAGNQSHIPVLNHFLPGIERYFPYFLFIYMIGITFMLFRFLINILQVRELRTQGFLPLAPKYTDLLTACQKQFDITRHVALFLSNRISVPMVLGVIKPVILLPVATLNHLSMEQLEAILSHELAHIKRHDYLVNMLQTIAETILFFNPFVWLISGIIRKEREHCCDDMAVACAPSPLPYARALAILEGNRYYNNKLTIAATGHKNHLFNRIKRIMEMKKSNINYSQLTIIIVAIIAITFTAAMFTFTPSFAQKAKKEKNTTTSDTTKKSEYKYKKVIIDANGRRTEEEEISDKPIKDKMSNEGDDVTVSYNDGDPSKKIRKRIITNNTTIDINGEQIAKEVNEAMKEVEKELGAVDWSKISEDVHNGLAEVNKELKDPKLRKEIDIEIKKGMEHTKEVLEQVQKELKKVKIIHEDGDAFMPPMPPMPPTPGFGSSDTYPGTNDYKTMLKQMEKDGLIDRSGSYKIEKENEELFINGKKQPDEVYNKYMPYLKDKTVAIKGNKGSLKITIDD